MRRSYGMLLAATSSMALSTSCTRGAPDCPATNSAEFVADEPVANRTSRFAGDTIAGEGSPIGPRTPMNQDEVCPEHRSSFDWRDPCREPRLFGHRGSKAHAPENTLAAFETAVAQGADGLEIDVRITGDGQLIALHDATLARTTDAPSGTRADELSLEAIGEFDAGSWFDRRFAGECVPTVDSVIETFSDRPDVLLLFDLKSADLVDPMVTLVHAHEARARAMVSSGSKAALERANQLDPCIPLLYYVPDLDDLADLDIPSLSHVRVPKHQVDDADNVERIANAGFAPVTGEYRVDYRYAFGLADDMPKTIERVAGKRPEQCE